MAGNNCSLTCNVVGRDGKVKVSALWEALNKILKGDRREIMTHYFLTKDNNFLLENSDVLEFDVDGEITIESLKKAFDRDGEYGSLSDGRIRSYLNEELKAGKYEYSEALENVLRFNKGEQFRNGYMATLEKESDGRYSISVVERNSDNEYKLASNVQEKIATEAIRLMLKEKGLSVDFIDNPEYAMRYSTDATRYNPVDGLTAIAQILDGAGATKEIAEVAGHFIVASMANTPLVERLLEQLTEEVQENIFHNNDSEDNRSGFIVSRASAQEAAGILVGKALLNAMRESKKSKVSKLVNLIPKGIKMLLSKIVNMARKVFGGYKPDVVGKLVDNARNAAATVAEGYISNPEQADVNLALNQPTTYLSMRSSKRLSEDVRVGVKTYYNTLAELRDIVNRLRLTVGRTEDVESDTNRNWDVFNTLETLQKSTAEHYNSQMRLESFAGQASLAGIVSMLHNVTHVLDTQIRSMLEDIQPSHRAESKVDLVNNMRNMTTINTTVKGIGEIYLALSKAVSSLKDSDVVGFNDADGSFVTTTLREALNALGDILVGKDESYVDANNKEMPVKGLQGLMESKRRQIFTDALSDFYGRDWIEVNAGKLWEQKGTKFKLINSKNTQVSVSDLVSSLDKDITWFDRYLTSAADCGDFVTAVGSKAVRSANLHADKIAARIWVRLETFRIQMKDLFGDTDCTRFYELIDDENGGKIKSGNLVSEVLLGQWEKDRKEFKKKIKAAFNDEITRRRKDYYRNSTEEAPVYSLTDEERGIIYHEVADPMWEEWNREHSIEHDLGFGRKKYTPNPEKYKSQQWEDLFDTSNPSLSTEEKNRREKKLKWYKEFMALKKEIDSFLPKNATIEQRAPQVVGRFGHRFRNLQTQVGNSSAFGRALRSKAQDFMVVRADEAWMFGSNNEFNEIEEDPLENSMYFEREKINRLPLYGINPLKDMSLLSTDLFGSMMEYASMAATYSAMEQVVDIFEIGKDVLKERQVGNKIEKERETESNAYSRYIKFCEKNVYGVMVTPPKWDQKGMWRKFINNLSSIGGRILLWGNIPGGIVNTGTGVFEILKEAISEENFNLSEATEANEMYFSGILGTIATGLSNIQRPDDKNSLWIRHWNILMENKSFFRNQKYDTKAMSLLDNRLWDWFGHTMMLPYSSGEHYMQTIPYFAMGIHIKVYDRTGKQMNLMDAYEIVDGEEVFAIEAQEGDDSIGRTHKKIKLKEGIFKSLEDINTYETVISIVNKLSDIIERNPNLRDVAPVNVYESINEKQKAYLDKKGYSIPNNIKQVKVLKSVLSSEAAHLQFGEDEENDFIDKCRNICNRLHGIYNTEDKVAFQQHWYGNLVMAMRGYALGMLNRRFADNRFNVSLGRNVEGSYVTFSKVLLGSFFDMANVDNFNALTKALVLTVPFANFMMFNKRFSNTLKADMLKAGFSEHQYYNMRRVGADFLVIEGLLLMMLMASPGAHFGLSDEDEDKEKGTTTSDNLLAGLIYYFMMRWDREQEAFNTPKGMWKESTSLLDYVPVGLSGARAIYEIADLYVRTQADKLTGADYNNGDLYYKTSKKGKYEAGDEKWKKKFLRLCPYIRSWYTFTHPYDAASGFEYGRRVRGK